MVADRGLARRLFIEAEAAFDWVRYVVRTRQKTEGYHIQAYRGHGTSDSLYLSGRVFEGEPVPSAVAHAARLTNLWHATQRLGSREVPAARVRASVDGLSEMVLADDEGFFEVVLPATTSAKVGEVWREVRVELIDPVKADAPASAQGLVIVPPPQARFGIISDIDDTVVRSDVANLLRMLRLVLLTNAHTRLPFPGVAAFYRALHAGDAGPLTNPIFYVSSSPWNFYDLLVGVFEVHGVPVGPLYLKDYGLTRDLLLSRGHLEHKLASIDRILEMHSPLPFLLIGDSGQQDPEVYRETVRRHPRRILAVYIRDVSSVERDTEIDAIAAEMAREGVELVRAPNTIAAAEHAASRGFIDPVALEAIREERAAEMAAPEPFDALSIRGK